MVYALLQVWYLRLKPGNQTLGDFTQEHSGLTGWVYVVPRFDTI